MPSDQTGALIARLRPFFTRKGRPLYLLLGSGATIPDVPGVIDLTTEATERAERAARPRDPLHRVREASVPTHDPAGGQAQRINSYSEAIQLLQQVGGTEAVQALVQWAALTPYSGFRSPRSELDPLSDDAFRGYESDIPQWTIPDGLDAVAHTIREFGGSLAQYILTTNFDPLVEIALRRAGILARSMAVTSDTPPDGFRLEPGEKAVLHLHGDCYGHTLHTPWATGRERPNLESWLAHLLHSATLLVVGYSGWDDIIGRVLRRETGVGATLQVLWTVYEDRDVHPHINPQLNRVFEENPLTITPYYGIDRDQLFSDLQHELQTTAVRAVPHRQPITQVYDLAKQLNKEHKFGLSHLKPNCRPQLVFWPHRLRDPHLLHGVHALTAMLLTQIGLTVELHLDDTYVKPSKAVSWTEEFTDSVSAWFGACGVAPTPKVFRISDLVGRPEGKDDATAARLWRLATRFCTPSVSAFDILLATKTIDPAVRTFNPPRAFAHRLLRPLFTWLALEDACQRHGLTNSSGMVVTLGGEDEEKMWDLWSHGQQDGPTVSHLYVPRLSTTAGSDLWDTHQLWRYAPFGKDDLERFIQSTVQLGVEGEQVLDWLFNAGIRLAERVTGGRLGILQYEGCKLESRGELLDALRIDPLHISGLVASEISEWFHYDGPPAR